MRGAKSGESGQTRLVCSWRLLAPDMEGIPHNYCQYTLKIQTEKINLMKSTHLPSIKVNLDMLMINSFIVLFDLRIECTHECSTQIVSDMSKG